MTDPITLAEAVREYQARKKLDESQAQGRARTSETPCYPDRIVSREADSLASHQPTHKEESETRPPNSLSERLFVLFGAGEDSARRWSLYMRVQSTVLTFGKPAELALREICDAARTKRRPGNYFAFAVVRRFRELGFLGEV